MGMSLTYRRSGFRSLPFLATATALVLASCSGDSTAVGPSDDDNDALPPVVDTFPRLSPSATAQALADPADAERGVRSLLANLGIGVYTSQAEPVFQGSERSALDFWVYDFEIALLASMPGEEWRTFEEFHAGLAAVGFQRSAAELLQIYQQVHAAHPDTFLVALLAETGLSLDGSPDQIRLDPLQEWLLFVDGFVPPNPPTSGDVAAAGSPVLTPALGGATGSRVAERAAVGVPADASSCAGFGGPHDPAWGTVGAHADNPGLPGGVPPALLAGMLSLTQALHVELVPSSDLGHHRHPDGNEGIAPDSVAFEVTVGFRVPPLGVIPCRLDLWSNVPLVAGPGQIWGIPDVDVEWDVAEDVFLRHGSLSTESGPWVPGLPSMTNHEGRTSLVFAAMEEEAEGIGPVELEPDPATVAARIDLYRAALTALLPEPSALGYMPVHFALPPRLIQIEWHDGVAMSFWAGKDPDQFGPILGALAGAIAEPQWGTYDYENSPAGLETLIESNCGLFPPGLHLGGTQQFLASGSAGGQTASMQTRTELSGDSTEVMIRFDGMAQATAVNFAGSGAEAATEELLPNWEWPALLVLDILNPELDSLEVVFNWEIAGSLSGDEEYSQWWADAHYRVRSCEDEDADWSTMFGIDDEFPEPSADSLVVSIQDHHVQLHILLSAGALANAYQPGGFPEEPAVESGGDVIGSLRAVLRPARDPEVAPTAPSASAAPVEIRRRIQVEQVNGASIRRVRRPGH